MLIQCPECQKEVSDQAASCPHCGHPMRPASEPPRKSRPSAALLLMAFLLLITSGIGTGWNAILPAGLAVLLAIASMVRQEQGSGWGVLIALLAILSGLYGLVAPELLRSSLVRDASRSGSSPIQESVEAAAKIVSSRWVMDPDFGTRGTIKWYVEVENTSQRYIRQAEVEFTTYDTAGNIVATTSTYVSAIPPGGRSSDNSYADYYRTEKTARFRLKRLYFE